VTGVCFVAMVAYYIQAGNLGRELAFPYVYAIMNFSCVLLYVYVTFIKK
jgi:hypothetical protein